MPNLLEFALIPDAQEPASPRGKRVATELASRLPEGGGLVPKAPATSISVRTNYMYQLKRLPFNSKGLMV